MKLIYIITAHCLLVACTSQTKREESLHQAKINGGIKDSIPVKEIKYCYDIEGTIGVVTKGENFSGRDTIEIIDKDNRTWFQFSISYDDSDGEYDFENREFLPFSFHPDYGLLSLVAMEDLGEVIKVRVNDKTALEKFIRPKEHNLVLLSWEDFIVQNVFSIRFDPKTNPVQHNGQEFQVDPNLYFKPVHIEGDKVKIEWTDSNSELRNGWIYWKQKECMIIELFFMS